MARRVTVDSPETLQRILRRIRRPFTGTNGIVVKDSDGGVTISLAKFVGPPNTVGGGDSGGGGDTFLVRLRQVGGSPGSATTPCTFTYDLWPLGETAFTDTSRILAIAQQPQRFQRPTAGLSIQAPNGSLGLAATVNSQTILLIAFDERIDTEGCSG